MHYNNKLKINYTQNDSKVGIGQGSDVNFYVAELGEY